MKKARVVVISIALLLPLLVQAQGRDPSPGSVFAPNNAEVSAAIDDGAAAFRSGDYQTAKNSFERVVKLAPSIAVGHLYLGTAYSTLMDDSEQGKTYGASAIREFKIYLNTKPSDRSALVSLGEVYWKQGAYEDALKCYRAAEQQESGSDTAYAIGAINRAVCQQAMFGKREMLNVDETPSLVTSESCPKLRNLCLQKINEGIDYTHIALRIKPDYPDAMLEIMLLFEFRSRLACGNRKAQKDDHEESLMWRQKLEQPLSDKQQNK